MPVYTGAGESLEARQIILVFERMVSDKTRGLIIESVVEGNPAQAVIKTVWEKV
jgi:hypothetical protein